MFQYLPSNFCKSGICKDRFKNYFFIPHPIKCSSSLVHLFFQQIGFDRCWELNGVVHFVALLKKKKRQKKNMEMSNGNMFSKI